MLSVVLFFNPLLLRWKYQSRVPSLCCYLLIAILDNQLCLNEFEKQQSVKRPNLKCVFMFNTALPTLPIGLQQLQGATVFFSRL